MCQESYVVKSEHIAIDIPDPTPDSLGHSTAKSVISFLQTTEPESKYPIGIKRLVKSWY